MKYLVMEIDRDEAIVLDNNGRFLRVKNKNYQKGDTVTAVVLVGQPKRKLFSPRRIGAVAAGLAAVIIFVVYMVLLRPVSSIEVKALSDVTLRMNSYGQVVDIDAANAEGRRLIDSYSYRYKHHLDVIEELLDRAREQGHLSERATLTIVVRGENHRKTMERIEALRKTMRARYAGRPGVNMVLNDITERLGEWDDDDSTEPDDADNDKNGHMNRYKEMEDIFRFFSEHYYKRLPQFRDRWPQFRDKLPRFKDGKILPPHHFKDGKSLPSRRVPDDKTRPSHRFSDRKTWPSRRFPDSKTLPSRP